MDSRHIQHLPTTTAGTHGVDICTLGLLVTRNWYIDIHTHTHTLYSLPVNNNYYIICTPL